MMNFDIFSLPVVNLPLVDVSTDPFDLLLTGIGLRLVQLAKTNKTFQQTIEGKNFTFQIMTKLGVARHFVIQDGRLTSVQGIASKPDFSLIFNDSEVAVKTLVKGDPTAFMLGAQQGLIKMEGDFSLLMWFNSVAKYIPPKVPTPVLEKVKQGQVALESIRAKLGL